MGTEYREVIFQRVPIRGREVRFLGSIFALSQRQFAEKLGLSHVAILKWERAQNKRLEMVNEIALKTLLAGMLGLKIPASIENLVGSGESPKQLVLDNLKPLDVRLDGGNKGCAPRAGLVIEPMCVSILSLERAHLNKLSYRSCTDRFGSQFASWQPYKKSLGHPP